MIEEPPIDTRNTEAGSSDSELEKRLIAHHKALFTRLLVPTILFVSVSLVIIYWRFDAKFYLGLGTIIALDVFNAYFSIKERHIPTPWGTMRSRSDGFDTFRWVINFIGDAFAAWCLEVTAGVIFAGWIILTFGALTEVYKKQNKLFTSFASLGSFIVLLSFIEPIEAKEQFFLVCCLVAIISIFWRLEISLTREMRDYFRERMQREKVESEAEQIRQAAAIGQSVRSLTHEINNLTAIASLTSAQIRDRGGGAEQESLERLDRSLELMNKTSCLVLDDLGGYCADLRELTLGKFESDARLLLGGLTVDTKYGITFDFPPSSADASFVERSGSTYLIVHNLCKNALEAIREKFGAAGGGVLTVSAAVDASQVILSVEDNGIGMSVEQLHALRRGFAKSTKLDGHGLGMGFVYRECEENGYTLNVESGQGTGSRFSVLIPIVQPV